MEDVYKKIKRLWNDRSKIYGDKIEGVLPKSFPRNANLYLDKWSFSIISQIVRDTKGFKILDLGCGYGRLSEKILKKYSNVRAYGMDITRNYVDIYNRKLSPRGRAIVGDIRKIPFADKSMDAIFMVATLMYIFDKASQKKVFKEIFRVLKKNGKFIIIERDVCGYNLITLGGLVGKIRGRSNREISAVGFKPNEITNFVKENGGNVERKLAIPFFTLSLPIIFFLNLVSASLLDSYLRLVSFVDHGLGGLIFPSIYIAYLGSRK